jgi:predicted molibdopterin-dependent oxidoreductase YjgC
MTGGPVRVKHIRRGAPVRLTVDGVEVTGFEGEHLSTVLMADGRIAWRRSPKRREPRGLFCGIGICFECMVEVEGQGIVRACQTTARDGMHLRTVDSGSTGASP